MPAPAGGSSTQLGLLWPDLPLVPLLGAAQCLRSELRALFFVAIGWPELKRSWSRARGAAQAPFLHRHKLVLVCILLLGEACLLCALTTVFSPANLYVNLLYFTGFSHCRVSFLFFFFPLFQS
jgi:hypothetical protein